MATPISTVNISLRTSQVSRQGFGTPIFISSHRAFQERVRTYKSLTAVAEDFNATDAAYIAAQSFFGNTPSVPEIKIGRREADAVLTPTDVADGSVHSITVTVNDGDAVTATFTADGVSTAETVVDALKAAIDGDAAVAAHTTTTKNGTGASATLTIAATTSADVFALTAAGNISQGFTTTEVAGDVFTSCVAEDKNFYFVTADDHSDTFVMAMAAAVQATERTYFVSNQSADAIGNAYSVSETDTLAKLKQGAYSQTASFWSETADTTYPECNYVGVNAPYSPDTNAVVWAQVELAGVPVAKNGLGNALTDTQQKNLDDRNVSYVRETAAGNRVEGGKMASGAWVDDIRTQHNMTARVREGQVALLANQKGSKVQGNQVGLALIASAITKELNPFVNSGAISSFKVDTSNATIDTGTRTASNIEFQATLTGAIIRVVIDGALTNEGA